MQYHLDVTMVVLFGFSGIGWEDITSKPVKTKIEGTTSESENDCIFYLYSIKS